MSVQFIDHDSLAACLADVPDGAVVATTGSGGGLLEPDELLAGFEEAFLTSGRPRGLTLVHALGIGDRVRKGTNRFAHPGMAKRVVGGHWTWSPAMLDMARKGEIEAYCLPSGAIVHLLREIGAGRPGLITKVGLGTFVDPRNGGGRCNTRSVEDVVELMTIDGEEYLRYRPFKVDVGLVRGTFADEDGNISAVEEPADLDAYNVALAARNSGGRVIAQVREIRPRGSFRPREVSIPAMLVDAVVVTPNQTQTYFGPYSLSLAGLSEEPASVTPPDFADPIRRVVARRAFGELVPGGTLNFGFGMSADVAYLIGRSGRAGGGALAIDAQGEVHKLVGEVAGITFAGAEAVKRGQTVTYVTERAVFRLAPEGVVLEEIAPGVDLRRDILDQMDFVPVIRSPRTMDPSLFSA